MDEREIVPMLTHRQVWHGIERLAEEHGLSASGLARRAGLDPTTFNRSKRITRQGKQRWPSTESLAKILEATSTSMEDFVALMNDQPVGSGVARRRHLRSIALDQMARDDVFDESGFPSGPAWEEVDFPSIDDPHAYAVEIRGDVMAPLYRDGDLVVVAPSASIRRQDRVLARLRSGEVKGGVLVRRTAQRVALAPFDHPGEEVVVEAGDLAWMARIVWASQ
jgi:phage repressor protein C with HTH and peptisase S24 domain